MSGIVKGVNCTWICLILLLCVFFTVHTKMYTKERTVRGLTSLCVWSFCVQNIHEFITARCCWYLYFVSYFDFLFSSSSWETIFSKSSEVVSPLELQCCRRLVQLCRDCLLVVYKFVSESRSSLTGLSPEWDDTRWERPTTILHLQKDPSITSAAIELEIQGYNYIVWLQATFTHCPCASWRAFAVNL